MCVHTCTRVFPEITLLLKEILQVFLFVCFVVVVVVFCFLFLCLFVCLFLHKYSRSPPKGTGNFQFLPGHWIALSVVADSSDHNATCTDYLPSRGFYFSPPTSSQYPLGNHCGCGMLTCSSSRGWRMSQRLGPSNALTEGLVQG